MVLCIGSYTAIEGNGIELHYFDTETYTFSLLCTEKGIENPSYLIHHQNKKWIFAVSEVTKSPTNTGGKIYSYLIDSSNNLTLLNTISSGGDAPCYLSIDRDGRFLFCANYIGGTISLSAITMTGKLDGPIAIQNHLQYVNNQCGDIAPHPHSIVPDTNNRYLLAADLGLDMICIYTLSLNNQKSFLHLHNFVKTQKNTGPRHISFHPSGKAVYVVGERSNTIETFQYDQVAGSLTFFSRHPLIPRSFSGNNTPADIQISPDGRYIYCSNRGNESITVFQTGKTPWELKYTQRFSVHGKNPRGICISRDGKFLFSANQDTHAIVCFKRDFASGVLSNPIAETQVKSPTSISIL